MHCGMPHFGQTVRRLREAARLSQEDLAAAARLSRATVQSVEKSTESSLQPRKYRQLAEALGLTPAELDAAAAGVEWVEVIIDVDGKQASVRSPDPLLVKSLVEVLGREVGAKIDTATTDHGEEFAEAPQDAADTDPTVPRGVIKSTGGVTAQPPTPPAEPPGSGKASSRSRVEPRPKSAKGGK